MIELTSMFIGALIFIACIREIAFPKDVSRMSWVKSGLVTIPFVFIARSLGDGQDGVLEMSGAVLQAGTVLLVTAMFFAWAKIEQGTTYERKSSMLSKTLAWVWMSLITSMMILKLSTGLA